MLPAPQIGGGYTYGYTGGGQIVLTRIIALLRDNITYTARGYDGQLPSSGLRYAVEQGWKGRTPPSP